MTSLPLAEEGIIAPSPDTAPLAGFRPPSFPVRCYCLIIVMLCSALSIIDRQIMSLLVEPIRREMALDDTHIGLLTGLGFAAVFAIASIPTARLADRWSRPAVMGIGVALWSVMTMACGAAASATTLLLARLGVGLGEASGAAPSYAYLSDLFPKSQRATAMSVMMVCSPLGLGLGLAAGGWALTQYGWRTTFLFAGLPGLVLAPLVLLTFPRVPQGMADGLAEGGEAASFADAVRHIRTIGAWPWMIAGATLSSVLAMGLAGWIPAFLTRSHGLTGAQIGAGMGAAIGTGSLLGHLAGGALFDWAGRRDLRWHFWIPAITAAASGILAAGVFTAPVAFVFPLLGIQLFLSGLFAGPILAINFNLLPPAIRATGAAIWLVVVTAISAGIGPQLVGMLSDALKPTLHAESLRGALLAATTLAIPATLFFLRGARTYRADVARASGDGPIMIGH